MNDLDLIVGPIGTLVTCACRHPRRGEELRELPVIASGAIGVSEGKIAFVGKYDDIKDARSRERIDASNQTVLPGFVDSHTHIPFLGDRSHELIMRFEGKSYMEIGRSGGGILNTMRNVRVAPFEDLLQNARRCARKILKHGVTAFEGKSGYGLDFDNEIKQLKVLKELGAEAPQKVIATCLSAHFVPPEFKTKREKYVELITDEILPVVAREELAVFVDVFCEKGAFTLEETRTILEKAKLLGLKTKIHADEIETYGGAQLAAELSCHSAEHLLKADDEGIEMMAKENVVATLLPATAFFLRKPFAPARKFIEKGCTVAVASDLNPGSSYTFNMLEVLTLGVFGMGLFPEEAIWASTLNGAYALGLENEAGSIETGKRADFNIFDVQDPIHLFYPFGENPLRTVVASGTAAWRKV
jgi:imidazolonepropionase